jgi:hypothetical protein
VEAIAMTLQTLPPAPAGQAAPLDREVVSHERRHRIVFLAAGIYNIGWGTSIVIDPRWPFRLAGAEPLNHPQVFACLGMVLALYGILYLDVARAPSRGWIIAAVGLAGKVLGPIGMLVVIYAGDWPQKMLLISLTNDLIWLPFFASYLYDAWPSFKRDLSASLRALR